jgi:DNA adenine methylase
LNDRAGPIGGRRGASTYRIDCRFPRHRLVSRLRACGSLASDGKVAFVRHSDAVIILREVARRGVGDDIFIYLDPPFWAKSDRLYRFGFRRSDHEALANELRWMRSPYLLSYDPAPEIVNMYAHHRARVTDVELLYTATQRTAETELIITNLVNAPGPTRLWRTNAEWRDLRRAASVIPVV